MQIAGIYAAGVSLALYLRAEHAENFKSDANIPYIGKPAEIRNARAYQRREYYGERRIFRAAALYIAGERATAPYKIFFHRNTLRTRYCTLQHIPM